MFGINNYIIWWYHFISLYCIHMSVLNKSFVVVLDVSQVDVIDTTFYKFWFKSRSALIRKAIQEYLEKHQ